MITVIVKGVFVLAKQQYSIQQYLYVYSTTVEYNNKIGGTIAGISGIESNNRREENKKFNMHGQCNGAVINKPKKRK